MLYGLTKPREHILPLTSYDFYEIKNFTFTIARVKKDGVAFCGLLSGVMFKHEMRLQCKDSMLDRWRIWKGRKFHCLAAR